jgi:hypothetical protein
MPKDKEIRDVLASKESGTPSNLALAPHKSEKDTDETDHGYKTKIVNATLTGNTVNGQTDFNIPLTNTSIGVTEFQSSDFTIWINFRLFFMSIGDDNGIPCEDEGIPGWIYYFGVDLTKTITE